MATDTEDAGFLTRWSRRKALVRQGAVVAEPAAPAVAPVAPVVPVVPAAAVAAGGAVAEAAPAADDPAPTAPEPPPLTLADVAGLTRDSDYTPFVGRGVQPEVRNAALGKLFTDPHFNVMDGLDTYIDDYGKPDPLPASMLRQMVQSQLLGLFIETPPAPTDPAAEAHAAESPTVAAAVPAEALPDEDPDLRLQPDDAAGRAEPVPGAGEDPGRQP